MKHKRLNREILELIKTHSIDVELGYRLLRMEARAAGLDQRRPMQERRDKVPAQTKAIASAGSGERGDIAIIGMSGRLPGARNLDEFWRNLAQGQCAISTIPRDRWDWRAFYDPEPRKPGRTNCRHGGFLEHIYRFDAPFFNMSGNEAKLSDPQQRLFLEEAWNALEDAGYAVPALSGKKCGVFAGVTSGDYLYRINSEGGQIAAQAFWGNESSVVPARVSYFLNLKGPSIAVNTACSSSLVALHLACQSLSDGDIEMAIVGSVFVNTTPMFYLLASSAELLSHSGQCRAFDEGADGMVPGEAVGAVILKPLDRALEDLDHIHGVIRASRINQDGRTYGITAPSPQSQTELLSETYRRFDIDPETIGYVEAHGTGTKLGDPIEIDALEKSFKSFTRRRRFCALGSVKTNIGHTMTAAGLSSLLKVLLCFKHRQIPGSLNFDVPNRKIDFDNSPFHVCTRLTSWPKEAGRPRRAAISAFGFSGTNAHLIVDEPTRRPTIGDRPRRPLTLIALSARSETALARRISDLLHWLDNGRVAERLDDIANTLLLGRTHFPFRAAVICADIHALGTGLERMIRTPDEECATAFRTRRTRESPPARGSQESMPLQAAFADICPPVRISDEAYAVKLAEIARAFVQGSDFDWICLYPAGSYRRVSLPANPFDAHLFALSPGLTAGFGQTPQVNLPAEAQRAHGSPNQESAGAADRPYSAPQLPDDRVGRSGAPSAAGCVRLSGRPDDHYSATEIMLAGLWAEELEFGQVDIGDNLFDLGLDSIYAARMASRLSQRLHRQIDIQWLFDHPSVAELAAFLDRRDHGEHPQKDACIFAGIAAAEPRELYPVSSAQRRLFVLQSLDTSNQMQYNVPIALRIDGRLEPQKAAKALETVIQRHEILRTSFHYIEGELFQKIHQRAPLEFDHAQAGSIEEAERIAAASIRPFDLGRLPLIRAKCFSLDQDRQVLFIDMHHIITDAASLVLLVKDFFAVYSGAPLSHARIHYKDYAVWQSALLDHDLMQQQKAYWLDRFSGDLPVLELPLDYARPKVPDTSGGRFHFDVDADLKAGLLDLVRQTQSSLNIVLLAAYFTLLMKYSAQEDIVVGFPVSGRLHTDTEEILGMFVNTLALRNFPSHEKSMQDFIGEVRQTMLSALDHQAIAFDDLVEQLNLVRRPGRNPLFDTMFVMQTAQTQTLNIEGFNISGFKNLNPASKFDLTLEVFDLPDGLAMNFEYRLDLFSASTIERMSRHYRNLLSAMSARPTARIGDLDILDQQERRQLLVDFNQTGAQFPEDLTLPQIFERKVALTPHAVAVIGQGKKKTYHRLNLDANRLAGYLLDEQRLAPQTPVGLLMDRSIDLITAILGILKAGCAYVPIDPAFPAIRMADIITDAGIGCLLIQRRHLEKAVQLKQSCASLGALICLDASRSALLKTARGRRCCDDSATYGALVTCETIKRHNPRRAPSVFDPRRLAYIIYTSGSTGKPKGVMIEHRSVVNILQHLEALYPLKMEDSFLLKTNYTFDVSVTELLGWFFGQGRLVILEPGREKDPRRILAAIEEFGITHINFVPAMLNVFLNGLTEHDRQSIKTLKHVFVAGENYSRSLAARTRALGLPARFENIYGPTECTIYVTRFCMDDHTPGEPVPIGKPLQNTNAYILDKSGRPVPLGVPGELCFGGVGLARGYQNRPELTARKFTPGPFIGAERIYHTGDLARWRADGNIDYLGRMDHQVKIRGYRIEMEEIEQVLLKHPGVADAVVVDRHAGASDHSLTAYYTCHSAEASAEELGAYLSLHLPDYMVPRRLVRLLSMPLNPSGKIDRNALKKSTDAADPHPIRRKPRDEIERSLLAIWTRLLGVDAIDPDDNFFELGGSSLKAIEVVYTLQKTYDIGVEDIFSHPTLSGLARKLSRSRRMRLDRNAVKKSMAAIDAVYHRCCATEGQQGDHQYRARYLTACADFRYTKSDGARNILLTGGTGFLGAHLVDELLRQTQARIFVLVRANSAEQAEFRLNQALGFYFKSDHLNRHGGRLRALAGDLTACGLDLPASLFKSPRTRIDCILNCAANVRHFGDYADFHGPNVSGVQQLLHIAEKHGIEDLFHISTTGIAHGAIDGCDYAFFTEFDHDMGQRTDNVYLQTKFLAEQELLAARRKGFNATIFRIGNLVGHSETGRFQSNIEENGFYNLMRSCLLLGRMPRIDAPLLEFTFVDAASKAVVALLRASNLKNETHHIFNPYKLSFQQWAQAMDQNRYGGLALMPPNAFVDFIFDHYDHPQFSKAIETLLLHAGFLDTSTRTRYVLAVEKTCYLLKKVEFEWPQVTCARIRKLMAYALAVGFFPRQVGSPESHGIAAPASDRACLS